MNFNDIPLNPLKSEPTTNDIVTNSYENKLYPHEFPKGKIFNVFFSDEDKVVELQISPKIKIKVSFVYIEDKDDISQVTFTKYGLVKHEWIEKEKVSLSNFGFSKILALLELVTLIDLKGISQSRISLEEGNLNVDESTRKKLKTLLSTDEGVEMVKELLNTEDVTSTDIVNIGYRKTELKIFHKLLNEDGFVGNYKTANDIKQKGEECVWQLFFEKNPWILGYGLHYITCNNLEGQKLEQVVSGFNFNEGGKRVDALLQTQANISQFVLVEFKTPEAPLIGRNERSECWSASNELIDGIAQVQKTVEKFKKLVKDKVDLKSTDGTPLGEEVYNFSPNNYLVIGDTKQFKTEGGDNVDKYSSFELFRKSITAPTIITFDELYHRAKFIVEHSESSQKISSE